MSAIRLSHVPCILHLCLKLITSQLCSLRPPLTHHAAPRSNAALLFLRQGSSFATLFEESEIQRIPYVFFASRKCCPLDHACMRF